MKKIIIPFIAISASLLTACQEKDQAYYLGHIDEAKSKKSNCENEMKLAIKNKDESKFKKLESDTECKSAHQALREYHRQEAEKERLAREAKDKASLEQAIKEVEQRWQGKDWQAIITEYANSKCSQSYISHNDYACRAEKTLFEKNVETGKISLQQLDFTTLLSQEKNYCGRDQRLFSVCSVWKEVIEQNGKNYFDTFDIAQLDKLKGKYCEKYGPACQAYSKSFDEKEKEAIQTFIADYDLLKNTYNQCVEQKLTLKGKWEAQSKFESSYPCKQAKHARIQLNLGYDNFNSKME